LLIFITPLFSLITLCYYFAAAYYCFADAAFADAAPPLLLRRFSLIRHAIIAAYFLISPLLLIFHAISPPLLFAAMPFFDIRCHFAAITLSIFIVLRCH
jgi:hypothetical protein